MRLSRKTEGDMDAALPRGVSCSFDATKLRNKEKEREREIQGGEIIADQPRQSPRLQIQGAILMSSDIKYSGFPFGA